MKSPPRCPDATGRVPQLGVPVQTGKKHRRIDARRTDAVGLIKAETWPRPARQGKTRQDPAAEKAGQGTGGKTFDVIADRVSGNSKRGKISTDYHGEMTRHLKETPSHCMACGQSRQRRNIAICFPIARKSR